MFASLFAIDVAALTEEDIAKFYAKLNLSAMTQEEVLSQLPKWLHDLACYFNPRDTGILPRRPGVDHAIDKIPREKHPKAHIFGLNCNEGMAVKAYIKDMQMKQEI
jgi:hypothetical protein